MQWEWSVQLCWQLITHTHLVRRSASRKEVAVVIAMNRQVKDIRVVVERLLGAVAMVNILRSGQ